MCQSANCEHTVPAIVTDPATLYHEERKQYTLKKEPTLSEEACREIFYFLNRCTAYSYFDFSPIACRVHYPIESFVNEVKSWEGVDCFIQTGASGAIFFPLGDKLASRIDGQTLSIKYRFQALHADTSEKREKNVERFARQLFRVMSDNMAWRNKYSSIPSFVPDWDAIGLEITNKQGTIGKRISKYVKHEYGNYLPQCLIESVNNIADEYRKKIGNPILSFDQDYTHKPAKEYCHANSCWWNSYDCREEFAETDGHAVRLWESTDDGKIPQSRVWIQPRKLKSGNYCHVVFNPYGTLSSCRDWGEMLASLWGMECKSVSVDNSSDGVYVNGNEGFIIFNKSDASLIKSSIDLGIETRPKITCHECGCGLSEDDCFSDDYHSYCCDCWPYVGCQRCGEDCLPDESISTDDGYYCCESCANRDGWHECYHCDTYSQEVSEDCDGNLCCDNCSSGYCEHCERTIAGGRYGQESTTVDDKTYCESCLTDCCSQCPDCEVWFPQDDIDGRCEDCQEKHEQREALPDYPVVNTSDDNWLPPYVWSSPEPTASKCPGIIFPEFASEPLQTRPVESAIDEWLKPEHGRMANAPLAILAINLCLAGF